MAINFYPTTILCSSHSKAYLADGIVAYGNTIRPGMLAEIVGRTIDDNVIYAPTTISDGPATCSVVLENLVMGVDGSYVYNQDEHITVAYIPPGEIFWGLIKENTHVEIGYHLSCGGDGYFKTFITPGYPNVLVSVALEAVAPTTDNVYIKMVAF